MKTLASIAAAGAIALGGIAASATGASANGWNSHGPGPYWGHQHSHYGNGYSYRQAPDNGGAIIAGALFGLAAGAIVANAFAPPPEPQYPAYASAYDVHVAWCRQTYTTYDQNSDSWTDFQGGVHQCLEPPR